MSNATLGGGGGGSLPGNVPLTFYGDLNSAQANGNNIFLVGSNEFAQVYDLNGIYISGDADALSFSITGRFIGGVATTDSTPAIVATLDTSQSSSGNATYTLVGKMSGYNITSNLGASYSFVAGFRKTGGVITMIGTASITEIEEGAMSACTVSFGVSGDDIQVLIAGYDSEFISWTCDGTFTPSN